MASSTAIDLVAASKSFSVSRTRSWTMGDHLATNKPKWVQFLLENNFELLRAIISTDPEFLFGGNQELLKHTIFFFSVHRCIQTVLKHFISKEVKAASNSVTLFRGISISASLLCGYFCQEAAQYVEDFMLPHIARICTSNRNSWEINPMKSSNGIDVKENLAELQEICRLFLCDLLENAVLPRAITTMLDIIRDSVDMKFKFTSRLSETVVAQLLILRCICPIIVSPEIGHLAPASNTNRRGLIIICKVIQNLVLKQEFGYEKEVYMCNFNQILAEFAEPFQKFAASLVKYKGAVTLDREEPCVISEGGKHASAVTFFYQSVKRNPKAILDELRSGELKEAIKKEVASKGLNKGKKKRKTQFLTPNRILEKRKRKKLISTSTNTDPISLTGSQKEAMFMVSQISVMKELIRDQTASRQVAQASLEETLLQIEFLEQRLSACACAL